VIWTRRGNSGSRGRFAGALAAAGVLALGVAGSASAAPADAPAITAIAETIDRDAAAVRGYWTPRRMRAAEPVGLRLAAIGRVGGADSGASSAAAQPAPVAASRWAIDTSATSTGLPERLHGKAFFKISGGSQPGDYVCSATLVSSNSHALAWTAGHCVHDSEFGGGFATNWIFVPGFRNGERPFGSWPARELFTTRGWSRSINIRQDIGAARLERDEQGRGIEDLLGARGIAFNRPRAQNITAYGYPALTNPLSVPPRFDFDGQRLWSCASPITGSDDPPGDGPQTLRIECDMTGGASGGGWVTAAGAVNGVTSYSYVNDGSHLYGPYFGSAAESLYDAAAGRRIICAKREVTNLGGPGKDDFGGTGAREAFRLKGGGDRMAGRRRSDAACGGGGPDRLAGNAGDDRLRGGRGRDLLIGGRGRDVCDGGPGRDRARGCEKRIRTP
jgi:hypothetical protein